MQTERFILEYIPKSDVQKLVDDHKTEIEAGASVWDICPPEYMAKERQADTEAAAWQRARDLLPLDEMGEVHVFHQRLERMGAYRSWETVRRSVVMDEDTAFEWQNSYLDD